MELHISGGPGLMFAVPVSVVDKYLRLATPSQLKVLLYLLRSQCSSINTAEISSALSMNEELIEEAVMFWEQTDVFSATAEKSPVAAPAAPVQKPVSSVPEPSFQVIAPAAEPSPVVPVRATAAVTQRSSSEVTLTPSEIASELKKDKSMMELFRMAEQLAGEPLTHMHQRSLLWQYQYLKIPVDIILTVMSYCRSIDKTSIQYNERILFDWWNQGLCTMKQINDAIRADHESRSYYGTVARILEMQRSPTSKQKEIFDSWKAMNIPADLIRYAYEKTVEQTGKLSLPYMNKIVSDWASSGYKTRDEVDMGDRLLRNSNSLKKNASAPAKKKNAIPESPMADAYRSLVYNIDE